MLAGGGYYAWRSGFGQASPADSFISAVAQRGDLEDTVTATGTLQPKEFVDVGTQVSGQLKKLHVEVGAVVKAGQLLAEIDSSVYQSKVDGDRAQLQNQRAQLADREAQLELQERQTLYALAILAGSPPQGFDAAGAGVIALAVPRVASGLPADLLTRRPDLASAEAQLDSANANVAAARAALLPRIQLTGSAGLASNVLVNFLNAPTATLAFGASLAQIRLSRLQASIGLYKALGGGWKMTGSPGGA